MAEPSNLVEMRLVAPFEARIAELARQLEQVEAAAKAVVTAKARFADNKAPLGLLWFEIDNLEAALHPQEGALPEQSEEEAPPRLVYCKFCHKTHAVEEGETPCAEGAWADAD
jgi:hypothetical protein